MQSFLYFLLFKKMPENTLNSLLDDIAMEQFLTLRVT